MNTHSFLPLDTQKEAALKQFKVLQSMDITARAKMTFELSDNVRAMTEAGIHQRHSEYSQKQIIQAVLSLTVDKALFKKAFPGCEVSA